MGISFQFATATQIIFGNNSIENVPGILSEIGTRILIVSGGNGNRAKSLSKKISGATEISFFRVTSEPTVEIVNEKLRFIIIFCRLLMTIIVFYFPLFYYCLMTSEGGNVTFCPMGIIS